MKSNTANILKRLIVPYGAAADDPSIRLGDEIPSELSAFYVSWGYEPKAVQIYRLNADSYAYDAVLLSTAGGLPYRGRGMVALSLAPGDQVIEFQTDLLDIPNDVGVSYIGGWNVGSGHANLRLTVNRAIEFLRTATFGVPAEFQQGLIITSGAILTVDPGHILTEDRRVFGATGQPALQNGWLQFGSGYTSAGFWLDPTGVVHLEGLVKSGTVTNGTVIATLPSEVGYRPSTRKVFTTWTNDTAQHACRIDVLTTGDIICGQSVGNTYLSLDGITFRP